MNCLAIDCSSEILGVAVLQAASAEATAALLPKHPYRQDGKIQPRQGLVSLSIDTGFRHAERLMPAVDYCMHEAGLAAKDLDLLTCTGGPGSFTGLRIALSTIKGLALGLGKPFVLVPTLDIWAHAYHHLSPLVVPALDAKRAQFYAAIYRQGHLVDGPFDITPAALQAKLPADESVLFVGPHGPLLAQQLADNANWHFLPHARQAPLYSLVSLALDSYQRAGAASAEAGLLYLRASDAEEAAALQGKAP